jgi:hypothetical protein
MNRSPDDELRPAFDFSGGVRGKYAVGHGPGMNTREPIAIERLAAAERARFYGEFRLKRPVVLTGALAGWPATLFHLARLAARFGGEPVLSYRLPEEAPAPRMSVVKSTFHLWSDDGGDRDHLRAWSFGEFLAALGAGGAHYCMANATKNTRLRDRLVGEAGAFAYDPIDERQPPREHREFFFGSAQAGPGLHHDGPVESFLCQLIGAKRIAAFSPADIPYLYPAASWRAPTGHFSAVADAFEPDEARFPLFRRATAHACDLAPGDALYMPPCWYHDACPREPGVTLTYRNTPPAELWGTPEDREALAQATSDLHERLDRLPPAARAVYVTLVARDLEAIPLPKEPQDGAANP